MPSLRIEWKVILGCATLIAARQWIDRYDPIVKHKWDLKLFPGFNMFRWLFMIRYERVIKRKRPRICAYNNFHFMFTAVIFMWKIQPEFKNKATTLHSINRIVWHAYTLNVQIKITFMEAIWFSFCCPNFFSPLLWLLVLYNCGSFGETMANIESMLMRLGKKRHSCTQIHTCSISCALINYSWKQYFICLWSACQYFIQFSILWTGYFVEKSNFSYTHFVMRRKHRCWHVTYEIDIIFFKASIHPNRSWLL